MKQKQESNETKKKRKVSSKTTQNKTKQNRYRKIKL